ncbi:DUF1496 domain-containing protein [uncultured Vibrio sp.]|uniref:DUF1496 domain-containing protein n=1 Tax=uncultured Vibrio sp. TaxID=114054 RepID=UPI0026063B93|nr:DUF1496 domain-containing protein [uncultured Vibrio sp.]
MTGLNRHIVNGALVVVSLLVSMSVNANKVISTPAKAGVLVTQGTLQQRICYYADKAYSIGAALEVSGVVIQCAPENDFEKNGSLAWVEIKKTINNNHLIR